MIKVEKAKNNFTIEMRIFENYEKVKYEIIKVIDFLRHAETNLGIFDNQNHELGLIERIIYLGIGFLPIRNISPIELGF